MRIKECFTLDVIELMEVLKSHTLYLYYTHEFTLNNIDQRLPGLGFIIREIIRKTVKDNLDANR